MSQVVAYRFNNTNVTYNHLTEVILSKQLPFTGPMVTPFSEIIRNVVGVSICAVTTSRTIGVGGTAQTYWVVRCMELSDTNDNEFYSDNNQANNVIGITDRALMEQGGGMLYPQPLERKLTPRNISQLTWDVASHDGQALQYTGANPIIAVYLKLYQYI